jgi:hypothetical protein
MKHACTECTDLTELIGREHLEGRSIAFRYGPLALAMKQGEELILENSAAMSVLTLAKVRALLDTLFIDDVAESITGAAGYHLTLR